MQNPYRQIKAEDLKKEGVVINGERHIDEGVYIIYSPFVDSVIKTNFKKDLKEINILNGEKQR